MNIRYLRIAVMIYARASNSLGNISTDRMEKIRITNASSMVGRLWMADTKTSFLRLGGDQE